MKKDFLIVFLFDYGFFVSILVIASLLLNLMQQIIVKLQEIGTKDLFEAYSQQNIELMLAHLAYAEPIVNALWIKTLLTLITAFAIFLTTITVFKTSAWNILKKIPVNSTTLYKNALLNIKWFGPVFTLIILAFVFGQRQWLVLLTIFALLFYGYFTPILYATSHKQEKVFKQAIILGLTQPKLLLFRLLWLPALTITVLAYAVFYWFLPFALTVLLSGAVYTLWHTLFKHRYYRMVNL